MIEKTYNTTRRSFIKHSALVGMAATLPTWLSGCGGDDNDAHSPGGGTREVRDLHFDFSSVGNVTDAKLVALNSRSDGMLLKTHTEQSRDKFRDENPLLELIPSEQLTHYLEDADLPGDALQSLLVTGKDATTGEPVTCSAHIHIPRLALRRFARRAVRSGQVPVAEDVLAHYQTRLKNDDALSDALIDINDHSSPKDVAAYLVFHHPGIMNLNPDLGCSILQLIYSSCGDDNTCSSPLLDSLAQELVALHRQGINWNKMVAQEKFIFDENDEIAEGPVPALDENGEPIYRMELHPDVITATDRVVREILKQINNNSEFEGSNWQVEPGVAALSQLSEPRALRDHDEAHSGLNVAADYPADSVLHGVKFFHLQSELKEGSRKVEVELKNRYLRFLSAYVQYFDAAGEPLPVEQEGANTSRAEYLAFIPSNDQLMGIPMPDSIGQTEFAFEFPAAATQARLYFAGLGLGGEFFCPEAVGPSILTLAINIGIPAIALAAGVSGGVHALQEGLAEIVTDPELLSKLIKHTLKTVVVLSTIELEEGLWIGTAAQELEAFLFPVANAVLHAIFESLPAIVAKIALVIGAEQATKAFPVTFLIAQIISAAANLAAIGQTIFAILESPALFHNDIKLTFSSTVEIVPEDATFPQTATRYSISANYGGHIARLAGGNLVGGSSEPLTAVFDDVPSGGEVDIQVYLFNNDGCIVAHGSAENLENLPEFAGSIEITVAQKVVPMTSATQYQHALKLTYDSAGSERRWQSANAPQDTPATSPQLLALNGITAQSRSALAAYGWQANNAGVGPCDSGAGGELHVLQQISLQTDQTADEALKFSGCGFRQPAGIVYTPDGTVQDRGRNFFIRPLLEQGTVNFHVLSVEVENTDNFAVQQTQSWGRFTQAMTSLALHPQGYLIGVARATHKMEILRLPEQPASIANAPRAIPFAVMKAGKGSREGLLDTPIAVAIGQGEKLAGTVLVLEQGNRRIQALDISANPVNVFPGNNSNFVDLSDDGSDVQYLDLGVDGLGYLYVLKIVGSISDPFSYRLNVYDAEGNHLNESAGVAAGRMAIGQFRELYTLNYEVLHGAPRIEPTVSQWQPSTPGGCA